MGPVAGVVDRGTENVARRVRAVASGVDRSVRRYDRRVTDRGSSDAPLACPFVAFEDDRDGRSLRPDHRHRCFAEVRPAPRAIAHQERYCLTAGFVSCPTFLDWARREAAAVREPLGALPADHAAGPSAGSSRSGQVPGQSIDREEAVGAEDRSRRDWAAPPPWSRSERVGPEESRSGVAPMPPFLAGRGMGGSTHAPSPAADLPGGGTSSTTPSQSAWATTSSEISDRGEAELREVEVQDAEPQEIGAREAAALDAGRRSRATAWGGVPPWERPRRSEAYPRLRTRMGLPAVPPLALAAAAVAVAALALFFVPPMLLDLGSQAPASPSPSPTLASPSAPASPTPTPAPTPLVYVVQSGDTLSKIAKRFGVSLDALIEANKDRIPNPDRIDVGDQIVIPTPPPDVIPGEPSPNASEVPASEAP